MERSGMAYTHIRSNSFFQNCLFDISSIKGEDRFFSCVGRVRYAKVDTRDIATCSGTCADRTRAREPVLHTDRTRGSYLSARWRRSSAGLWAERSRTSTYPNQEYEEYLRSTGSTQLAGQGVRRDVWLLRRGRLRGGNHGYDPAAPGEAPAIVRPVRGGLPGIFLVETLVTAAR